MGTIKLYHVTNSKYSTQFIVEDYPGLNTFSTKNVQVKRLNMERYFKGMNKNYLDYVKIMYGPVFGMDDVRNGFIYEDKHTEEMIRVPEEDIPVTYAMCDVIMADLMSIVNTDTTLIQKGIVTSYEVLNNLLDKAIDKELFISEIKDMWILDRSFLLIE